MILDERTEFADATALNTGAAGTYNVGDVIDTQGQTISPNASRAPFAGDGLYLVIQVDTAATSGGAATVDLRLVSDATAVPATNGTAVTHFSTGAKGFADLTAGKLLAVVKLPAGQYKRYVGIQQVTGTAAVTAGKINAFLTNDPALFHAYADNV